MESKATPRSRGLTHQTAAQRFYDQVMNVREERDETLKRFRGGRAISVGARSRMREHDDQARADHDRGVASARSAGRGLAACARVIAHLRHDERSPDPDGDGCRDPRLRVRTSLASQGK